MADITIVLTYNKFLTDLLLRREFVFFQSFQPMILIEKHVLKPTGHVSFETCFTIMQQLDFKPASI